MVEEGLNGRTTAFDDPGFRCRNGSAFLESSLLTHEPIDVVVVMLGTNDLKPRISGDPAVSAESLTELLDQIRSSFVGPRGTVPKLLIVSPPHLGEELLRSPFSADYGGMRAIEASRELAPLYRERAKNYDAAFLDAADHAVAGADGVHMDAESHGRLGEAVADAVRGLLSETRK